MLIGGARERTYLNMVKKKVSKAKQVEIAQDVGRGLVEMYQAGFVDGYNDRAFKKKKIKSLRKKCIKAFEKRFNTIIKIID